MITSGGGFSTQFPRLSWQSSAVSTYLGRTSAAAGYNPNGRAFPDIAFVGVKYPVAIGGAFYSLYGTSASTPFFAAMSKPTVFIYRLPHCIDSLYTLIIVTVVLLH